MKSRMWLFYLGLLALVGVALWVLFGGERPPAGTGNDDGGPGGEARRGRTAADTVLPVDFGRLSVSVSFRREDYNDPRQGGISGHVYDPVGKAVPNIAVEIIPTSQLQHPTHFFSTQKVLTDKNGYYALHGLDPNRYYFLCGLEREILPVEAGKMMVRDVTLPGLNSVSGEVVDGAGRKLFPANVYLLSSKLRLVSTTNESGRFQIRGIPDGGFQLWARSDGFVPSPRRDVEVENGEDLAGLVLTLEAGCTLFGTVQTNTGKPLAGIRVSTAPDASQMGTQSAVSDAQGYFEMEGLPAGEHNLQVLVEGSYVRSGPTVEVVPNKDNLVVIVLPESGGLLVRAVTSDGEALPEDLALKASRSKSGKGEDSIRAQPDERGFFQMNMLEAGTYAIHLESTSRKYILPPARNVEVQEGTTQEIVINLDKGGQIEGRVLDSEGKPVSKAKLSLTLQASTNLVVRRVAHSETDGRYLFDSLPGGTATVEMNVRGFQAVRKENLVLPPSGKLSVDLLLNLGIRLEGRVLDSDGRPVPGATVAARPTGDATLRNVPQTVSDAEGRYSLTGLEPGRYSVYAIYRNPSNPRSVQSTSEQIIVEENSPPLLLDLVIRPPGRGGPNR